MLKRLFALAAFTCAAVSAQAVVLDLGTNGSGTINGAIFEVSGQHPTGTGVFDPFLTIQNTPVEQGYNSSTGNFDTKREPQWNHEVQLSSLATTTIDGQQYYTFVVDINEPNGSKAGISLNALQIYTSPTIQTNTSTDASGNFNGSLGTLRYTLGDNSVLYTDTHSGSGTADITIFVPTTAFAGASGSDYLYMYQRFGNSDVSEGGFEETAYLARLTPVPEMNALFPIIGLLAAVLSTRFLRRRAMAQVSE